MRSLWVTGLCFIILVITLVGCSGSDSPATPPATGQTSPGFQPDHLIWGLWECHIDSTTWEIETIPLRGASFTANMNNILAGSPGSFTVGDLNVTDFQTEGKLACTVTIKHPLEGVDKFHGFDVWGVFIHNGGSQLNYNLLYYANGPFVAFNEAYLLNPDGYTRWFNMPEFDGNGSPLLEFWPGTPSNLMNPTSNLNGYKIFADGLGSTNDFHDWITSVGPANNRCVFSAGASNSRRYQIQFPMVGGSPELKFQFAIIANWEPGDPSISGNPNTYEPGDFPPDANADEAFYVHTSTVASTLFNDDSGDPGSFGGEFKVDIEIFDWQGGFVSDNGVPNEIERIYVEADFIPGGSHDFSQSELASVAVDGTSVSSVFQVEVTGCEPDASGPAGYWLIIESAGVEGDSYDQGFPSKYPVGARRAAFYRGTVDVLDEWPYENTLPVINLIEDDLVGPGAYMDPITKDETEVTYDVVFVDPDPGQEHSFTWWITTSGADPEPSDVVTMPHDWSTYSIGDYDIYVEVDDSYDPVLGGPFGITLEKGSLPEWSEALLLDSPARMPRACLNPDGDIVLVYHKDSEGIAYEVYDYNGWVAPVIAFNTDPDFMHITSANPAVPGETVYIGYSGTGDEAGYHHALRWPASPGLWDYMLGYDSVNPDFLFVPNDDTTFASITPTGGDANITDTWYSGWGSAPGSTGTYTDANDVAFSSCNFEERGISDGAVAHLGRLDSTSEWVTYLTTWNKSPYSGVLHTIISNAGSGILYDTPSLCMDLEGNLHVAWKAVDGVDARILYSKSVDFGQNWTPPVEVYFTAYGYSLLDGYIGIDTDSTGRVYITYCSDIYLYFVSSIDGIDWTDPNSPYTGPLPLGYHHTQCFPLVDANDDLHLFFISKNGVLQYGALVEYIWG